MNLPKTTVPSKLLMNILKFSQKFNKGKDYGRGIQIKNDMMAATDGRRLLLIPVEGIECGTYRVLENNADRMLEFVPENFDFPNIDLILEDLPEYEAAVECSVYSCGGPGESRSRFIYNLSRSLPDRYFLNFEFLPEFMVYDITSFVLPGDLFRPVLFNMVDGVQYFMSPIATE